MFHLLLTFLSLMFSTSNPRSKASETSATAWCLGSVKPTDSLPVHQKSWRHDKTPRYFRRWRLTKPGCSIPWATVWNQGVQGQPVRPEIFCSFYQNSIIFGIENIWDARIWIIFTFGRILPATWPEKSTWKGLTFEKEWFPESYSLDWWTRWIVQVSMKCHSKISKATKAIYIEIVE